jgi:hypothetical protein
MGPLPMAVDPSGFLGSTAKPCGAISPRIGGTGTPSACNRARHGRSRRARAMVDLGAQRPRLAPPVRVRESELRGSMGGRTPLESMCLPASVFGRGAERWRARDRGIAGSWDRGIVGSRDRGRRWKEGAAEGRGSGGKGKGGDQSEQTAKRRGDDVAPPLCESSLFEVPLLQRPCGEVILRRRKSDR